MTFTEQSIQTAQVAFFLIDHIGTPPAGANFRSFTTRAMEEHLKKHPCYYRQRPNDGPAKPTLVTPLWMRRRFTDLYKKANHNFYEPRLQGDDITDTLLRKRSTAGFPAEVLATYRYERGTFSESELPANEEPLDEEMTDIEAAENLEAQIDDGARQKANEHDGVKSPRRRTAAKSSNLAAKRIPPRVVRNSEEPSGETEDDDNDLRSTGGNKALDNEENDHSYAGDHGRRITRHGKDTSKVTSKSAVEVAGVRSKAIAKAPYDASRKETETSTSKGRTRLPQASTMTKPSKRKREGDTDATQASSNSDELVITPKKRRVTNNAKTRNGTARRLSNDIPVAARTDLPPSGPRLDRSAPTPSPITPRVKQNDAQPVAQVAKIPAFAQPDPTSSSIGDQHQPVQTLNYASAQKNKDLYAMLDKATDRVIGSIGRISQTLSSLDKSPSNRLEALYIRCWGPDWKTVKAELIEDGAFQVCDVTMSIIAAFLFDNVLNQQASLGDIEAKQKELKGMTGWAILEALDLKNNEHGFAKRVRAIETKHARELLAKSPASVTEILEQEAKKFTKELWGIIKPHFRGLSTLANAYDLSSDLNERDWQEAFDDNITTLIEAALRYRLELLASGYDHAHTWPEADEKFDEAEMEIHGANRARQNLQVLFTVFPGTKEMVEGSNKMETYSGTHATVKVRSAAWETYD